MTPYENLVGSRCSRSPSALRMLSLSRVRVGRRDDAALMLAELTERASRSYVSPISFAWAYRAAGDRENWVRSMYAASEERCGLLVFLKCAPWNDQLRAEPEFQDILQRVGSP
jgi:hypothetical protein